MSYFSIGGLQLELKMQDNLALLERKSRAALKTFPWLNMLVFSELAIRGPGAKHHEPVPGPTEERLQELARDLGIWLIPGSYYEECDGKVYNSVPVINPDGEVVTRYRKIYPFLPYEKDVADGDQFVVFDVPEVGRFGVSICYDMWVPETVRALVWQGAEVIIHPTMTGTIDRELELCIARSHAITNQCYFVDINGAGAIGNGQSIIVGPEGDVISQAGTTEQVLAVELDLRRVRRSRERGVHGLGQVLKSYRDNPVAFPQYQGRSKYLDTLGPLEMPGRV